MNDHAMKSLLADLAAMRREIADDVAEAVITVPVTVDLGPLADAMASMAATQKSLAADIAAMKAAPAATPIVNVNVDNVRVTSLPDRVHRVSRDNSGKPTGSVETDA